MCIDPRRKSVPQILQFHNYRHQSSRANHMSFICNLYTHLVAHRYVRIEKMFCPQAAAMLCSAIFSERPKQLCCRNLM
jgi:hypothetical protein